MCTSITGITARKVNADRKISYGSKEGKNKLQPVAEKENARDMQGRKETLEAEALIWQA